MQEHDRSREVAPRRASAGSPRGWLAAALALASALALGASSAGAAPRLQVDQTEIDLGTLVGGDTAQARFVLRNVGDRELRVLLVQPG